MRGINVLEKNETIAELELLAEEVLALKKNSLPRRPIVIEFCGSPKAGKSTCINSLHLFLRRNNFRTKILNERAGICPINSKFDPLFNIWTMSSALAELSEVISNHSRDYDVIILDRGLFDAICWFSWQKENDFLHEEDYKSFVKFITTIKWRSIIDVIYTFTVDPNESLTREHATLLTNKTGSVMRIQVLHSFKTTLIESMDKFSTLFRNIQNIDTTKITHNEVNYKVTKDILNILKDITIEKIGYINANEISCTGNVFNINSSNIKDLELHFGDRSDIEKDTNYVQPIPIAIITNKEKTRVLIVRKQSNKTSKQSPEYNKNLIYFGGHIRDEDRMCIKEKNTYSTIKHALFREIKEEVGLDFHPNEDNPICIWLKDNLKSKKHLAICFVVEKDLDFINITLDRHEFSSSKKFNSGQILDIKNVVKDHNNYEEWSKILLEKVFSARLIQPLFLPSFK